MGNLDGLFGIVAVACGLYCFYAYYMMKKTGEINTTILLSKDMNVKKCKDKDAYLREAMPMVLVLGIASVFYGAVSLFESYVMTIKYMLPISIVLFGVAIVWFAVVTTKARKKYF